MIWIILDQSPAGQVIMGGPLAAASKMVPVPESLMSPDCGPTTSPATIVQRNMQNCANQPQPQTPQIPKAIKTKGKVASFFESNLFWYTYFCKSYVR